MKVRISGGYTGSIVAELRHRDGISLAGGTFRIGLFATSVTVDTLPSAADPGWKTPTQVDTSVAGVAVLTWAVSEATGYAVGRYRVWAKATLSPFVLVAAARDETVELV
jgi:hypothetical protein